METEVCTVLYRQFAIGKGSSSIAVQKHKEIEGRRRKATNILGLTTTKSNGEVYAVYIF